VGLAAPRVNRQRRFTLLVQTGLLKCDAVNWRDAISLLDLALLVPEESVPEEVGLAAHDLVAAMESHARLVPREMKRAPPEWFAEWLEREGLKNPFA
jgi:hypothetical protein